MGGVKGSAAQAGLIVVRLPIRAGQPLRFWLARSEGRVDFNLIKATAARHPVLVSQNMPARA
jgi:hypothetical protein